LIELAMAHSATLAGRLRFSVRQSGRAFARGRLALRGKELKMARYENLLSSRAAEFAFGGHGLLIDGRWLPAISGETIDVIDPATGRVFANVPAGGAADIDKAVAAARRAFTKGPWQRIAPAERGRLIWRLADRIEELTEEFAQLESLDSGKPVQQARTIDIPETVARFRYMAGWAGKINGETVTPSAPGEYHAYTVRRPIGVVGQIIPWNFPLVMAAYKLAPALAAGCTIVLKPAEQTPLTALRLGRLMAEVGFPDGVLNIVTGYGETAAAALVAHGGVDKIAFTGSTEIGKIIAKTAASNLTPVSLELGGKSPVVVFRDADLDCAIPGAAAAIFFNQGQTCTAGSRLFIANACGISVRYLHTLCKRAGFSIGERIRELRLEACRVQLSELTQTENLAQTCYRWGFSDQAHFSRQFRARFGLTPREAKRQAAAARNDSQKGIN
jgi:phenylacetaldehyde dehydrogenase